MTFVKAVLRVMRRELKLFAGFRTFSTLSVGLPLVALLYFVVLIDKGVPEDMPVAVVDRDNTELSRQLTRMIDATPAAPVAYHLSDMQEGEKLMREGKIDAIVDIPRDLEKDVFGNKQANVVAYINGTNVTKNGILDRDIRTTLYTFSSGIEIQLLVKKGISEKEAYDMMMPIYYEKHILFNPYTNYAYYLLPIFLPMMLLIFTLLTTIFTIGTELRNATAPYWLAAGNGNIFAAFLGKVLPYTFIFTILSIFIDVLMFKIIGVPMRGHKGMLLASDLLFVMAYQSIGVFIITLVGNMRLGLSVGGGYSVLAFTFSGMTFPLIAMYPAVQAASRIFPLTYYMELFIDQAMRGAPAGQSVDDLLYIAVFILLPLPLLHRLKRLCSDAKYWGKL